MGIKENKIHRDLCLITGATGLVGANLIPRLITAGYKVRALYRSEEKREHVRRVISYRYPKQADYIFDSVEWVKYDLTSGKDYFSFMQGVNNIFHCAGFVSFQPSDRAELFSINVGITEKLVKTALDMDVNCLCHVSSIATIDTPEGEKMTESMGWEPERIHSVYAESKYAAEQAVWAAISKGLKAIIVNPAVILGPGFWDTGSSVFFKTAYKGMPVSVPGGTGIVDVADVADIMVTLTEKGCYGERFILSGADITYRKLFLLIAQGLGVKPPFIHLPRWVGKPIRLLLRIYHILGAKPLPLTPGIIKSSFSLLRYNGLAVSDKTGFKYRSAEETISELCRFFLSDISSS